MFITPILGNDQLHVLFLSVFILRLYMFRAASAHHQETSFLLAGRADSHSPECVIQDGVLIQFGPPDDEHLPANSKLVSSWPARQTVTHQSVLYQMVY
jgi:hypothetical protein